MLITIEHVAPVKNNYPCVALVRVGVTGGNLILTRPVAGRTFYNAITRTRLSGGGQANYQFWS